MSTPTTPPNYSIHSIIAAYGIGLIPHGYYFVKMMANANGLASNILPRENLTTLKGKLPSKIWTSLARAHGAHMNAMENLPLFAVAMLAGNVAKLPTSELNTLSLEYLGARLLYMAAYMGARSEAVSYVRTGLWAWSVSIPVLALVKAGNVFRGKGE
ncbi:MAPEG family protein [Aspergillus undulatus]|uniref:MAPEG family protein n=1 Tax=Aspergillus undulatus TaxID=1810928 RepID=UPI003CCC9150